MIRANALENRNRNSHTKRCQNFFCFVSVFLLIVQFTRSHTTYHKKVFVRDSDIQKGGLFIFLSYFRFSKFMNGLHNGWPKSDSLLCAAVNQRCNRFRRHNE
jgi:hypothetical protein